MLHIFYRFCPIENPKNRPTFYSKITCLKSFIIAFHRAGEVNDIAFNFLSDGPLPDEFQQLISRIGYIEILSNLGNAASLWYALIKAMELPDEDFVYFVEDDYLHVPNSLIKLIECLKSLQADYVALYDHPVRYMPEYEFGADWPLHDNYIYITNSHHWRPIESICMTFGGKVKILKEDQPIFDLYVRQKKVPADRKLFRHLQCLGNYTKETPRRLLIGPVPSLATHCELPWLAPIIDWNSIAYEVEKIWSSEFSS